ncbi:MAG: adenylate/guanylate cyclase domain-containing protein [Hyphomonadaceae bacterium]
MTGAGEPTDTAARHLARREATIVAIDAAGYSRQSEIDEGTAVREIEALSERIRAGAASRGGRVFNTAGDGFMLEFPSVSTAVTAAEQVLAVDRVPLRIGVHVGDVHETSTGDLLGKGVNVAARLMALAQPGSIVLSGDAKRALSADVAARLSHHGPVRLDKMQERVDAYVLGSAWKRPRTVPLRMVLAGAGALVVVITAWFGANALLRPNSSAIAVLEFRAFEPPMQAFAAGLADRLIGAMSEQDLQPAQTSAAAAEDRIAAGAATGAAFVLDGTVRPEGEDVLVSARLIDTRGNLALWSREYRRVAREQEFMRDQIAIDVARVLKCALVGLSERTANVEPATLSLFLRACDQLGGITGANLESTHLLARDVTEQAPRFSRGWSMRARTALWMSWESAGAEAEAFTAEAREAVARARRLDRSNGEPYLVEAALPPGLARRQREALFQRALEADPDLAAAHWELALFYNEVGRSQDALRSMRRAVALEPLNANNWSMLPPLLSAVGGEDNQREANELRERLYRIWPNSAEAWDTRFLNSVYVGDPRAALQMLDEIESAPVSMHPLAVARWRSFLIARQSGDRARLSRAALALRDLMPDKWRSTSVAAALSLAGEVDAALEIVEPVFRQGHTVPAFMAPWANLRRDRRFMSLMRDTGLIQYWRETGQWPDFCRERNLSYNCEQEAARVLPS